MQPWELSLTAVQYVSDSLIFLSSLSLKIPFLKMSFESEAPMLSKSLKLSSKSRNRSSWWLSARPDVMLLGSLIEGGDGGSFFRRYDAESGVILRATA